MEDSIYGISKHYDPKDIESCREWFKSKLKDYWEKDIAPSHVFPAKDSTTWELYQGKLPDWSCAIRILQMKNVQETLELKPVIIPGLSEPPVRTLRATIPENESHIFR